jgi:predicted amidohydrolase YtcJ
MKLFINAAFHLLNDELQTANAILVENGKIDGIFHDALPHFTDCETIDLKGLQVYPGFIDTHAHCFEGGLYSQSIDLSKVSSIRQVLEKLDEFYQKCNKNEITEIDAFRFDENNVAEKRFPTLAELNCVCPDIPLVLRRVDGHSSTVNGIAWKKFCEGNKSYLEKNMHFDRLSVTACVGMTDNINQIGVLSGELNDKVVHWFHNNLSEQAILNAYQQASKIALTNGITTVHTMVGDSQNSITHYKLLKDNLALFDVEFILYPQSFNIKQALEVGATRIGGCILSDGALGSHTAALSQAYSDNPRTTGLLYHDDAFWSKFITESHNHGLQVAVHCIGDRAIKQINDIYLKLYQQKSHDLRHELIHCELTPNDLVEEIVQSHAIPVMQPAFDLYWGAESGFYHKVLGEKRHRKMNRFQTFLKKGVTVTGGSDWYITELDALQGIRAAVNHHNPLERLNAISAIDLYTRNAALLSHDGDRLGKLSIGFDADFVCLDKDILTSGGLAAARVIATYKRGKQVYSR